MGLNMRELKVQIKKEIMGVIARDIKVDENVLASSIGLEHGLAKITILKMIGMLVETNHLIKKNGVLEQPGITLHSDDYRSEDENIVL